MKGFDKHLHELLEAHPETALEHARLFSELPLSTQLAIVRRRWGTVSTSTYRELMTWNFRLVKHTEPKSKSVWYGIHEVFYNEVGKPWAMTQQPIQLEGESAKDISADLKLIQLDLKRLPILNVEKIKWATPPKGVRGGRSRKKFASVKNLMKDLHGDENERLPRVAQEH